MIVTIRQKLKANEKKQLDINLKNIDIGPDIEDQGNTSTLPLPDSMIEPTIFTNNETYNDVGSVTEAMKKAAIETIRKTQQGKKTRL